MLFETDLENTYNTVIQDATNAIALRKNSSPNYRYVVSRLLGASPETYTDMEYDLSEHGRIIDTDSLVASALRKKRQCICKAGIELTSSNKRNLEYIQRRLEEIEYVTSMPFESFIEEIAENLVNFNNAFVLKYRNEDSSSGRIRTTPTGTEIKPIAGLYLLAAPTIDTANNKQGNIIKYRHRINEYYTRVFKAADIAHIYQNKRTGITVGTPPLEAVKDDLYALRNIEQSAESMIYRNASPFIHVKVGEKDSPARMLTDGTSEVDLYSSIIDNMVEYGGVATPHRVNIELKGAESQALRLESYLTYFQNRVLAGLCVSQVDLGIGSSTTGGSAAIISQSLKDEVRAYQKTVSTFVSNTIFNELLLESNYYSNQYYIPKEDRVILEFNENDIDLKIKIESHYLNMFQGGLITKEFAMQHVGDMTEEDIQPDPPVVVSGTKSTQTSNSNALKSNTSAGQKIKDSDINFRDKEEDLKYLHNYLVTELLLTDYNYAILDSIYTHTAENIDTLGFSNCLKLLNSCIDDLVIDTILTGDTHT